jgi:hypothetical protein
MSLKNLLKKYDISPTEYIKIVHKKLLDNNLDPKKLKLASDEKHKFNYDGVKFGSVINRDFIIYSILEKNGKIEKGTANMKRKAYRARAKGIYEKSEKLSPSYLSMKILW